MRRPNSRKDLELVYGTIQTNWEAEEFLLPKSNIKVWKLPQPRQDW